ncbi:MAG: 50S ribosomal protein L6 [bacterium]|tara:strand:+ start:668 stop:1222 length:555 start_codon:yes stop_codon:yes gene_type:complete
MSRIGNKEIEVLNDVKVDFNDGLLKVVGPKGNLQRPIPEGVKLDITDGKIKVSRLSEDKKVKALHGLVRSLINNMVIGVSQGFEKSLEIIGTGYKCDIKSKSELVLNLGYSNPINFKLPEGIDAEVENKGTILKIKGINNEVVGEIAARIRKLRKPERYKGKGVRYQGEYVKLKAGKAAGKGAK